MAAFGATVSSEPFMLVEEKVLRPNEPEPVRRRAIALRGLPIGG